MRSQAKNDPVRRTLCTVLENLGGDGVAIMMNNASEEEFHKEIMSMSSHLEDRVRDSMKAKHEESLALFKAVVSDVDDALDGMGYAPESVLVRSRLRALIGKGLWPDQKLVDDLSDLMKVQNTSGPLIEKLK